jgi:hypothetical protein
MVSLSPTHSINPHIGKTLCRIVGLTCLAGFAIDMLALSLPPDPLAMEWRLNFIQQASDRSIVLLFGSALTLYGNLENRRSLKQLALGCLVLGVAFQLSCILVVHDGVMLQRKAIATLNAQADQYEENLKNSEVGKKLTPDQLRQMVQMLDSRTASMEQNHQTGLTKAGISSVGNLVAVGLALISLGRYGMKLRA